MSGLVGLAEACARTLDLLRSMLSCVAVCCVVCLLLSSCVAASGAFPETGPLLMPAWRLTSFVWLIRFRVSSTSCPSGRYNLAPGQTACLACPIGAAAHPSVAAACQDCTRISQHSAHAWLLAS